MFKASELELLQHLLVDVPLTDSTLHSLQQQHTNLEAVAFTQLEFCVKYSKWAMSVFVRSI